MKLHLLIGFLLTCCIIAIGVMAVPRLEKKLAANRIDHAVGALTFTCEEFSTSRDFLFELPGHSTVEKPNGPLCAADDSDCIATVRAFYTFTDSERSTISDQRSKQINDLVIGKMLLRDTYHWGLIREYGVYRDRDGYFVGKYLQHRLSNPNIHKMANEALGFIHNNWLLNDVFNQRATLIEQGVIPHTYDVR